MIEAATLWAGSTNVRDVTDFESLVPPEMRSMSGSVFYTGTDAFSKPAALYLLGLNPGGDPLALTAATVEESLQWRRQVLPNHSAYRDEEWANGKPAGTWSMQPRVLHLLNRLDLDPGEVPASNLVFVRSAREASLASEQMRAYADACWPFHAAVIETLQVRVVVCFGGTVGRYVRARLGADREVGTFVENNQRRWTSRSHAAPSGLHVLTLSHPSIADWRNPATDPTDLVAAALHAEAGSRPHERLIETEPPITIVTEAEADNYLAETEAAMTRTKERPMSKTCNHVQYEKDKQQYVRNCEQVATHREIRSRKFGKKTDVTKNLCDLHTLTSFTSYVLGKHGDAATYEKI